jgi:hypothetical protein
MVQVSMSKNDRIELGKRMDLRDIKIGGPVRVVGFFSTVDKHPAVGSGEQEGCTPDFTAAPAL